MHCSSWRYSLWAASLSPQPCSSLSSCLVLRFTVDPRGRICPLKHCHTALLVQASLWDQARDAKCGKARRCARCEVSVVRSLRGVKYEIMLWLQPSCERRPRRDLSQCPARAEPQLSPPSFPYRDIIVSPIIKLKTLSAQRRRPPASLTLAPAHGHSAWWLSLDRALCSLFKNNKTHSKCVSATGEKQTRGPHERPITSAAFQFGCLLMRNFFRCKNVFIILFKHLRGHF